MFLVQRIGDHGETWHARRRTEGRRYHPVVLAPCLDPRISYDSQRCLLLWLEHEPDETGFYPDLPTQLGRWFQGRLEASLLTCGLDKSK